MIINGITIKDIRLIVSIHNQQAGIIQCRLVFLFGTKLNGVVGGESHGRRSLDYLVIILPPSGDSGSSMPLPELDHTPCLSGTPDIVSLPVPVPLFRVVDTNTHNFQQVLYNNTFFRNGLAANRPPTAEDGSVRAKEFLYTFPHPYEYPVQLGTHGDDKNFPHNHNNHKPPHVSDHDAESPHQSYGVVETYSKTKWQRLHRGV